MTIAQLLPSSRRQMSRNNQERRGRATPGGGVNVFGTAFQNISEFRASSLPGQRSGEPLGLTTSHVSVFKVKLGERE